MADGKVAPNALDRILLALAPTWALQRIRARAIAGTISRHYEAAQLGRRTANWNRSGADANIVNGAAIGTLRALARDLERNNPWARRGVQLVANSIVGWGLQPKPVTDPGTKWGPAWRTWSETPQCDADERLTFSAMQSLAVKAVVRDGEVLLRRRRRRPTDGLAIPLAIQVLEADFIDTSKDQFIGQEGGPVIQGIEHDALGRRVAYYLFEQHPGSNRPGNHQSRRVSAADIIHVFRQDRPGQVRGVSWLAQVITTLRDFDEYEDATLMRQKIAACFAAFVTDPEGGTGGLGEASTSSPLVETLEPGMVSYLKPGQEVAFGTPPVTGDDGFSARTLRRAAAGVGVTYEDLTGDYSQTNYSSGRMGRQAAQANVEDWRWNMLIPLLCDGIWGWAMEAAELAGIVQAPVAASWTPPPAPMIDPDKEGTAYQRLVRAGAMTPSEMVRAQGRDPEAHWAEYAADLKQLDDKGIWLDSDVRRVSAAGLTQERTGGGAGSSSSTTTK